MFYTHVAKIAHIELRNETKTKRIILRGKVSGQWGNSRILKNWFIAAWVICGYLNKSGGMDPSIS